MPTQDDDEYLAYYESLWSNPPDKLITLANAEVPSLDFEFGTIKGREYRIWEGYLEASCLLLREIVKRKGHARGMIFPALFNLRHAIELALKWHIQDAGGTVPRSAGHDLEALAHSFRRVAAEIGKEAIEVAEGLVRCAIEISSIDPRSTAFRYATERDGSPIPLPSQPWDIRSLSGAVEHLSILLDNMSDWLAMGSDEYQDMLRELERSSQVS